MIDLNGVSRILVHFGVLLCTIVAVIQPAYSQDPRLDKLPVVGDAPDQAPPLATDLSSSLDRRSVDKAIRRVADWQLRRLDSQFNTDWTMAALYAGFMAAS